VLVDAPLFELWVDVTLIRQLATVVLATQADEF
jgi:hypothetical protein